MSTEKQKQLDDKCAGVRAEQHESGESVQPAVTPQTGTEADVTAVALSGHDTQSRISNKGQSMHSMQSLCQGLTELLKGFTMIARSGYLRHVCLHFVLHYIVSTFFYLQKTRVVAAAGGSASQVVASFALMNSLSAAAVAVLQLTATVGMCFCCCECMHSVVLYQVLAIMCTLMCLC